MNSSLKHIVLQLEDLTQQDISIDLGLDVGVIGKDSQGRDHDQRYA